jgi:hypothetical protein
MLLAGIASQSFLNKLPTISGTSSSAAHEMRFNGGVFEYARMEPRNFVEFALKVRTSNYI